jgi:hypothetical protein
VAQQATERIMNQQRVLDDSHPLVRHVLYLEAMEPTFPVGESPDTDMPFTVTPSPDVIPRDGISTGWAWVVSISVIAVFVAAIVWLWRRRVRPPRGSYNDNATNQGYCCCKSRRRQVEYLAYPSPDPSPRHNMDPVMPGNGSADEPWAYPQISSKEDAGVPYFDPVLAVNSSSMDHSADDKQEDEEGLPNNQFLPGGFFPSTTSDILLPNDDDSFVVPFQDDDDDIPATPSSSWLRDLV